MASGPWRHYAWRMPPDRSRIAVRITSAEVVAKNRDVIGEDGAVEQREVRNFKVTSQRANSEFGERPKPYVQYVPVHEVQIPHSGPHEPGRSHTARSDELLRATGIGNCIGKLDKVCLQTLCGMMKNHVVLVDVHHFEHEGIVFDCLDDVSFFAVPD